MKIFNDYMLARYIETKNNEYYDAKDAEDIERIDFPAYKWSWKDLLYIGNTRSKDDVYYS